MTGQTQHINPSDSKTENKSTSLTLLQKKILLLKLHKQGEKLKQLKKLDSTPPIVGGVGL